MEDTRKFPGTVFEAVKLLLLFLIISFVSGLLLFLLQKIIELVLLPEGMTLNLFDQSYFALASGLIPYLLLLLYLNRSKNITWSAIFRFKSFPTPILLPMIILTAGGAIVLSEIDNIFRFFIPIPEFFIEYLLEMQNSGLTGFILIVLIAPLFEEVLFRGIILEGFLSRYSSKKAIIYSSIIFSLFHLNPVQFCTAFFGGVILGYLYIKTRSLLPSIILHAMNNGLIFILPLLNIEIAGFTGDPLSGHQFQPLWFDLTGIILLCIGLYLLMKFFEGSTISSISGEEVQA